MPELNTSRPLTPVVPALALRMRKLPLVFLYDVSFEHAATYVTSPRVT